MKKVLIFLVVLIVLVIGAIYLFIPNKLLVAREVVVNANSPAAYRIVADQNTWTKWWPKNESSGGNASFVVEELQFDLKKKLFKTLEVVVKGKDQEYSSAVLFVPLEHDSALVRWEVPVESGSNPITKLNKYFEARKIANSLSVVLKSLSSFLENEENVYNLSIKHGTVADTAFLATRNTFNYFPSTEEVYAMIGKLHEQIAIQNGKEKGYPMLNIDSSTKGQYNVMVAIATDRLLSNRGDVELKRMIQGNILLAEVTGGPNTVKLGMSQMAEFVRDHQMTPAAIPFQLLVTDRLKEKDTTKWVTELRYPVF